MTAEERFERIEADLAGATAILRVVAASQERQGESLSQLTETITRYVDSADARMKRIEENLDGLLRRHPKGLRQSRRLDSSLASSSGALLKIILSCSSQ